MPNTDFIHLRKHFGEDAELLQQKGVYPYDFMDSFSKFNVTNLPSKDQFYSKLNNCNISDENYQFAQRVWKEMKCETFADYHDIYLKTDVLLLTDIFEKFRTTCLKYYKLDPLQYFTVPGLAWDTALKMTKVKLQLLKDIDMHLFVEKPTGGISMISTRYA